jgi:hypothetical protein
MQRRLVMTALTCVVLSSVAAAQTRRPTARPALQPAIKEEPAMTCPNPLGTGVATKRAFCDVLIGRDPSAGILIPIPPHEGDVTLTFDLHNRHLVEAQAKDTRAAYARHTASIGALTMDNTLISRAAVQSEFRAPTDVVDRIGGGAGPEGVKAVAPTGQESIKLTIPEAENQVSILGEKETVESPAGIANYAAPGRAIAIISNVMIEYHPPPAKPPAKTAPPKPPVGKAPTAKPPVKRPPAS